MTEHNPYAPPQALVNDPRPTRCAREGKNVFVPTGSDLPRRCIYCNEAVAPVAKKKKVYWHSPWLYLLLMVNVIVYAVVGLIARKSFELSVGLCVPHATTRRRRIGGWVALCVGAVLLSLWMLSQDLDVAGVLGFTVGFIGLIGALIAARTVYARKITAEGVKLGGCKEPFLASLE